MATQRLLHKLQYGGREIGRLQKLIAAKQKAVYLDTLHDLLVKHGTAGKPVVLSQQVLGAIERSARDAAEDMVLSYNKDIARLFDRYPLLKDRDMVDVAAEWATKRGKVSAVVAAKTEIYNAHADATIAFYRDNGVEPVFDFGGHTGDQPAKCSICRALVAGNPWSLHSVIKIGSPHFQCAQSWGLAETVEMPSHLVAGLEPAGILGSEGLMQRHRNQRDTAVAYIESLA